jgi:hypothetical protein
MIELSTVGKPRIFESDNYDSIKELIDPDILYNALYATYADILEGSKFEDEEDDEDNVFLKRFSQIHHGRKQGNIQ